MLVLLVCVVVVYLFMIMPRMSKQKETKVFEGRYYAHRGLHDNKSDAPENSYKAFENAVANAYGIELDIQLTKDEVMVVFHDDEIKRVCGEDGKVSDYTYEEIQKFRLLESDERIPRFIDVLSMVDGKVPLIVEIKMSGSNTRVCELAHELLGEYKGIYCVESFNPIAVRWYKKNAGWVVRGQLSSAFNKMSGKRSVAFFLVENLLSNVIARPDFVAYDHRFEKNLSRRICRKLFHCFSVTWTIKSQEELDKVRACFDVFIFEGFIPK